MVQVTVIPAAVGDQAGELEFRYYPHMPGNSTCHTQEKWELQGSSPEYLFLEAQDCLCPVTTISALMEEHAIAAIHLLKVHMHVYFTCPAMAQANPPPPPPLLLCLAPLLPLHRAL